MLPITLVMPPLTQLNTPYPSTAYLVWFLRQQGRPADQRDLGIELLHRLFTAEGLAEVFQALSEREELPEPAWRALSLADAHLRAVEPAMAFLRGLDSGLAPRILETGLLPVGPATARADRSAFGKMGTQDAARHLATLYLHDLVNLVSVLDPGFGMSRYQHHLALGARDFGPLHARLQQTTLVDAHIDALADSLDAPVVGLSVPFPGNLYGALRLGRRLKAGGCTVLMGGGYVNTELREVDEPRLWECVDALTYDDGEGPLLALLEHLEGGEDRRHRTRTIDGLHNAPSSRPAFTPAGTYDGLQLDAYLQLIDTLNPAHRLWADGRWNKMTLAHGCYWRKCSFCDVNLDYIGHYETTTASLLVDHMERLIEETGQRGFHFVDEAAPPKMLKAVALEVLRRNLGLTMWGNIRFEKAFTPDLCRLLAAAGMVAVTGGLEVANERLLKAIRKGVTVEQVACAAKAFRDAGILVHAYLMYGFPTQTNQETIDSMEVVRQLFAADVVNSAFWHRFVLTRHAPIFEELEAFGVQLGEGATDRAFAANDLPHLDPSGGDHDLFDDVLPVSLDAWMRGRELNRPVHSWCPGMPPTQEAPDRVAQALQAPQRQGERLVWVGGGALATDDGVRVHTTQAECFVLCTEDEADWLMELLDASSPVEAPLLLRDAVEAFPGNWDRFAERFEMLSSVGLLRV